MTKCPFFITCLVYLLVGQNSAVMAQPAAVRVTYHKYSNGKLIENQDPIVIYSNLLRTEITTSSALDKTAKFPIEQSYIDRQSGKYVLVAQLNADESTMTVDSTNIEKQIFELTNDYKTILGHKCRRARTVINSNKYDLWFTNDLRIKGAPTVLGQNLGLVLEVDRNGTFSIIADKIKTYKKIPAALSFPRKLKAVDMLSYRYRLWRSRFTSIEIFRDETINFTDRPKSNDSVERFASGTVIARKIKFPTIKKGSRVFVEAVERSNGDAYDRTGSLFLIPDDSRTGFLRGMRQTFKTLPVYENGNGKIYHGSVRTEEYTPPTELMRFFTPFGIGHYNTIELKNRTWQDSVSYRQEITELIPLMTSNEVWIGANISNYDKGGHKLSVRITIHPDEHFGQPDFAMPLFMTNNILETDGQEYSTMFDVDRGLEVEFNLPESLLNASLRYIVTGHGGWDNGDEFLPKKNTICLNDTEAYGFIPWRNDCGSYRNYNPASGNFQNGLSSSDYSRSNWCPGTVTNPVTIPLGNLEAGTHRIQIKIPQGPREGNSFSSWNVSGVLLGFKN